MHGYDPTPSDWRPPRLEDLILYELHVGTFSPAGTFAGVAERLPYLSDLMPANWQSNALRSISKFPFLWPMEARIP